MSHALSLAKKVKGKTVPNPAVGAVVVKNDQIVGEGATAKAGGPHAERSALHHAGEAAKGATLYVTLEPCCHFGRTPPCTDAIISSGISRVVAAIRDPNPLVAGKGIRQLKKAGVGIEIGCMSKEAARLNEEFLFSIVNRQAFITLKLALTLDGYIADRSGESKWITSEPLRKAVHGLRGEHAAVGVGYGTLIADNPLLNVRYGKSANPARIVFSSKEELPEKSNFVKNAKSARTIVVVRGTAEKTIMIDTTNSIEYWFTGEKDPAASMKVLSHMAFDNHLTSIFIEGGQVIASTLLDAGLVNRIYLFYGSKLLGGGKPGILFTQGLPVTEGIILDKKEVVTLGNDFYVTGIPKKS